MVVIKIDVSDIDLPSLPIFRFLGVFLEIFHFPDLF